MATYYVGQTTIVSNFDPSSDVLDLGPDSIHNQIPVDTADGLTFLHMFDASKSLLLEGVSLGDLHPENFAPIADAHLQQDLSAALAWEDGSGLVRPNTVYIRSHEEGLEEIVDFDPATDKISFFYLSVRGDGGLNFAVEETAEGVRFYSPLTGQSMTLRGVSFSDLDSSHFEWRANQLEDGIAGRMGLESEIDDFQYVGENIFSGKSVAMAGLVDRAPYHTQPEYTGTPRGGDSDPDDDDTGGGDPGNDPIVVTVTGGSVTEADPGMEHEHEDGTPHVHDDGHRFILFEVSLAAPATEAVTLTYRTADGTAVADTTNNVAWDYHETSGTLVFAPGEQTKTVSVAVHPDTLVEGTETFAFEVSGENITGNLTATGTIYDNDGNNGADLTEGTVTHAIVSQWGEGFVAQVSFAPDAAVDGWVLQFEMDAEIVNLWDAEIVSRDGNLYTIMNAPYNGSVGAGSEVGFGFQAAGSDSTITFVEAGDGGGSDDDGMGDDDDTDGDDDGTGGDGDGPFVGGGETYYVGQTSVVTNFDPTRDVLDLGPDSIHNQIPVDTADGLKFLHMFDASKSLLLQGVNLGDLHPENFAPISDAHLQQDLSAALAWEDGSGLVRPNTVYIRSHEEGLEESVDFDPATDKISFFYLSVRGDGGLNFAVEETAEGVRFFSPLTGQSMTLRGVSFSDLDSSHFEWRANQLEDGIAGRMGLESEIDAFQYPSENVFSGKSVAMAGLVDRAPYHSQPEYTGTPRGADTDPDDPGSTGNDSLTGTSGDDDLRGLSGDDSLYGDNGRDQLRGQDGDDTAFGGSGADSLFGGNGDDRLLGETGNDRMVGGSGSDVLFGDLGRDLLNGGGGTDTAYGGLGDDTFIIDTATDQIFDAGGNNVLRSDASDFALGTSSEILVERVILNTAAGDARMVGNANDDILTGNGFDNSLLGRSGEDRLNGIGGTNTMTGGSGDDTFVVTTSADVVRDLNGQGVDLVRAVVDYTLPSGSASAYVENLRIQANTGDLEAAGNDLGNTLEGNSGDNRLRGLAGDDVLVGGDGDDLLFGGGGADRFEGESGNDTMSLGNGDVAIGGSGMDQFRFGAAQLGSNGSGGPIIRDFDGVLVNGANSEDKLVFTTGLETGSFAYIGGAAFSGSGNSEARFAGPRQIQVDQDGDGAVDQAFLVDGVTVANLLTATDFVWL